MFRKHIFVFILILGICSPVFAQQKYWITFNLDDNHLLKTRGPTTQYKLSNDIDLFHNYMDSLAQSGYTFIVKSEWLKAGSIYLNSQQIENLRSLSFIDEIIPLKYQYKKFHDFKQEDLNKEQNQLILNPSSLTYAEHLSPFEPEFLEKLSLKGEKIRIAIFDGGFKSVDTHPAFSHLRENKQIIQTWDFVESKEDVFAYSNHGSVVLSCIAGIYNNKQLGLATQSEFLLARTELSSEKAIEEDYWIAALEWAYKNGAKIISSSLGYVYHRYFKSQMDGTSMIAKAADIAASKGLLIINSMGNEGSSKWEIMGTPADAQDVLSVGSIDLSTGLRSNFSSTGPTADYRLKPNVVAPGKVLAPGSNKLKVYYGTSFSCPLITGFAACIWQAFPEKTNMEIFRMIEQCGHLYPYYDYDHGYGVPSFKKLFSPIIHKQESIFVKQKKNSLYIFIKDHRKTNRISDQYLYYSFLDKKGRILSYGAYKTMGHNKIQIEIPDQRSRMIMIHHKGINKSSPISTNW